MTVGRDDDETMKPQHLSLLALGGAVAVITAIVFALGALVFQCL